MASTYTIIYTYTGQSTWTSATRSVSFSNFTASGDTDKTIGQITGMKFECWYGTSSHTTQSFQAQLICGSSTISSTTSTATLSSSTHTKVTSSFSTLPTATQLASLTTINFLVGGTTATTSHPTIYWAAKSGYPMKLIVSFTDEPEWVYHPEIEEFTVARGTSSGDLTDSGTKALFTIKLNLASSSYASSSTLMLRTYLGTTNLQTINLTSNVSTLLSGVSNYYGYTTFTFEADADYRFELTFACNDESVSATAWLSNTFVAMHIAPYSTGGVAIGDLSTASEGSPKFEVHHKSYFYSGIENFRSGVIAELGNTAKESYQDGSVSFDRAYSSGTIPVVLIDFMSTSTAGSFGKCTVAVTSVSNTGFSFRFFNGDSSSRNPKFVYLAYAETNSDNTDGNTSGGDSGGSGGGTTDISTIATRTALGAIMAGTGLDISSGGVLSLAAKWSGYISQYYMGDITFGSDEGYTTTLTIPLPTYRMLRTNDYGTALPTSGLYAGRIFFLKKS